MSLTLIPTLPRGAFGTRASGALPPLPPLRPLPVLTSRRAATLFADDAGAATAEYAVATMAIVERIWRIRGAPSSIGGFGGTLGPPPERPLEGVPSDEEDRS